MKSLSRDAERLAAARAEQIARDLTASLARDCPDLRVALHGSDVEIRGPGLRERQAEDARLRFLVPPR